MGGGPRSEAAPAAEAQGGPRAARGVCVAPPRVRAPSLRDRQHELLEERRRVLVTAVPGAQGHAGPERL